MPAPLRIGFIGTGYIAGVVARALHETDRVVLTGVASRNRSRAASFGAMHAHHGELRPFGDWREMLSWEGIDAVYIATPTVARTEIALAAAARGKHVLAEKPFTSAAAVAEITKACHEHGVAFLDATHFVHHPRHHLLKSSLNERIGALLALNATFTFPSMDRTNIRHDPSQEPTGAFGDMAWYVMRALVEFTPDESTLEYVHAFAHRDTESGAVVRSAGVLQLDSRCTATWDVAFDIGTCLMDLHLMGPTGRLRLDDFVLDWAGGFAIPLPGYVASFEQQSGVVNPSGVVQERVPTTRRQLVSMLERFAELSNDPTGPGVAASVRATRRTQQLLDDAWSRHTFA